MASITSLSNSNYNTSSIYGSRNVVSGLASGMDTESMIQNAVSGIKTKIQGLYQKRTKIEWQQEAYRSIIDKAANLSTKYTSYASKTNLMSNSFFANAVNTAVLGTYKDKITATGKTSSDIKINAVTQMATAASYTVSGLGGISGSDLTGKAINPSETMDISNVKGTIELSYAKHSFDITLDDTVYENMDELAAAINEKLGDMNSGIEDGMKADQYIEARVVEDDKGGKQLVFAEKDSVTGSTKGSSVEAKLSGKIAGSMTAEKDGDNAVLSLSEGASFKTTSVVRDALKDTTLNLTLDGVTKKIDLSDLSKTTDNEGFQKMLKDKVEEAFGDKVTVNFSEGAEAGTFGISFETKDSGSTLSVSGTAASALGFSEGDSNYINTGKKLSDLLGDKAKDLFSSGNLLRAVGSVKASGSSLVDSAGNTVQQLTDDDGNAVKDGDGNDIYYRVNNDGKALYDFEVNGAHINVTEDTTLERLMNTINSNADAGVKVSYSKLTNEFKFTATETGSNSEIKFGGLAKDLFGDPTASDAYFKGKDAILDVEINCKEFKNLTRSSNSFDIDGLTINVKGEFKAEAKEGEEYEAITFNTTTDSDKIVNAIREFVNDYNEMATEIKNAYSTLPAQKSNGARYEPLTSDEEEKYSESELKSYNEKAKQGILFGDSDLSSMYSKLLSAISPGGTDGRILREIGLDTSYSGGMTTLSLDEDKLRAALESDPDKVKNAFTKTREGGSSSDGLMQSLQNTLDAYAKTTGEPKGILVSKAGSVKAYTSLNSNQLQSKIDSLDTQIERWQEKMSSQIDRYTSQFSKLEQLIAQMNSQSSTFSGLMGGSSGY